MTSEGEAMTTGTVVILVPVLRRPHRVSPTLESIESATPGVHVLFLCTPGDDAEIAAIDAAGAERLLVERASGSGDYAAKINAGYRATSEPFLFLAADDLWFHLGWFEAAMEPMLADPAVGVVGTQDLGNPQVRAGRHSTHSLVRRAYVDAQGLVDEPGKVLCEQYEHEWTDNELVETAMARGAWAFAAASIVEHLHPHWGKSETDPLYDEAPRRMSRDRPLFNRRRALWQKQR